MHILLGFAAFVGLVAFAFGMDAARNIVRIVFGLIAIAAVMFAASIAYDVWIEPWWAVSNFSITKGISRIYAKLWWMIPVAVIYYGMSALVQMNES